MRISLQPALLAAACISASAFSTQSLAADEGWDWIVAPYVWAASIGTDYSIERPPVEGGTDSSFSDVIDKIDGAFMIHAEGQGDHFGLFTDFLFLGLSEDKSFDRIRTSSDLDSTLFELAVVYSPGQERFLGLDLFGGLRYLDVDLEVGFDPTNPNIPSATVGNDATFSDFMLGGRYTWALADRWGLTVRADGSFGDTEGTFNTSAIFNYKMKRGEWLFGYRYLDISFDIGSSTTDISIHGPQFGYGFNF